jgi:hypothetical protein
LVYAIAAEQIFPDHFARVYKVIIDCECRAKDYLANVKKSPILDGSGRTNTCIRLYWLMNKTNGTVQNDFNGLRI